MGEHPPVGRLAVDGHRGEQAALEPAPVLVGAFQIEVGRIGGPGGVAGAGARSRSRQRPVGRRRASGVDPLACLA